MKWCPERVFLISGGMDSAWMVKKYAVPGESVCVFYDYGHPSAEQEKKAVIELMKSTGIMVTMYSIPLCASSMRTGAGTAGPRVVPLRNLAFLTFAASVYPESEIFLGCTANDQKDYPDCRPAFIACVNWIFRICGYSAKVKAPFIGMTKKQIFDEATSARFNLGRAWSCYQPDPNGEPCGTCNSCIEIKKLHLTIENS